MVNPISLSESILGSLLLHNIIEAPRLPSAMRPFSHAKSIGVLLPCLLCTTCMLVASQKFKSWKFLKLPLNSKWISNFISKCLFASWYQHLKYPTDISPVTPLKLFLEILPRYFPSDPLQVFPEILPKYSTDISPSIFFLRNTFRIIFQVPTNIFSITFLMLIRICMPPVSYGELYKLISLIQNKYMLISH
jgi:hypothetical protein